MDSVLSVNAWGSPVRPGKPAIPGAAPGFTAAAVLAAIIECVEAATLETMPQVVSECSRANEHIWHLFPADHADELARLADRIRANQDLCFVLGTPPAADIMASSDEDEEDADVPAMFDSEHLSITVDRQYRGIMRLVKVLSSSMLENQAYQFIARLFGQELALRFKPVGPNGQAVGAGVKAKRTAVINLQVFVSCNTAVGNVLRVPFRIPEEGCWADFLSFVKEATRLRSRLCEYADLQDASVTEVRRLYEALTAAFSDNNTDAMDALLQSLYTDFMTRNRLIKGLPKDTSDHFLKSWAPHFEGRCNKVEVALQLIKTLKQLVDLTADDKPRYNPDTVIREIDQVLINREAMADWMNGRQYVFVSDVLNSQDAGVPAAAAAMQMLPMPPAPRLPAGVEAALADGMAVLNVYERGCTERAKTNLVIHQNVCFHTPSGQPLPVGSDRAAVERYVPFPVSISPAAQSLDVAELGDVTRLPPCPALDELDRHQPFGAAHLAPSAADVLAGKGLDHPNPSPELLKTITMVANTHLVGKRKELNISNSMYELLCHLWRFIHMHRYFAVHARGPHLIPVHKEDGFCDARKAVQVATDPVFRVTFAGAVPDLQGGVWAEVDEHGWWVCAPSEAAVRELLSSQGVLKRVAGVKEETGAQPPVRLLPAAMGPFFAHVLLAKLRGVTCAVKSASVASVWAALSDTATLLSGGKPMTMDHASEFRHCMLMLLIDQYGFMPFPVDNGGQLTLIKLGSKNTYKCDIPSSEKGLTDALLLGSPNFRGDRPVVTFRRLLGTTRRFGNFSAKSTWRVGDIEVLVSARSVMDRISQLVSCTATATSTGRRYYDQYEVRLDHDGLPQRNKVRARLQTEVGADTSLFQLLPPVHECAQCALPTSDMTDASSHWASTGDVPVFVETTHNGAVMAMTADDRVRACNVARKAAALPLPTAAAIGEAAQLGLVSPLLLPGGSWDALQAAVAEANNIVM
jgi:hypothetical protein